MHSPQNHTWHMAGIFKCLLCLLDTSVAGISPCDFLGSGKVWVATGRDTSGRRSGPLSFAWPSHSTSGLPSPSVSPDGEVGAGHVHLRSPIGARLRALHVVKA